MSKLWFSRLMDAPSDMSCAICQIPVFEGDGFYLMKSAKGNEKVCEQCKDEILEGLDEEAEDLF